MARINMELIVDELDENFAKVLKAVMDEVAPDCGADNRQIMSVFRKRLERGFERDQPVLDRRVALLALHVVLRDVHLMDERDVVELGYALGTVVAAEAAIALRLSRAHRDLGVTTRAGGQVLYVLIVVDHESRR